VVNREGVCRDVVTIGASAGGVETLLKVLGDLPDALPATIAVVLHRHPYHPSTLTRLLARNSSLPVTEPDFGEPMRRGHVYVAPRDHHLTVDGDRFLLDRGPKQHWTRPAIDPLFVSAARTYGQRVVGVLLSGGGSDGVRGLVAIKAAGGLSLVQDPQEARHPTLPIRAISDDDVDAILSTEQLPAALAALAAGKSFDPSAA
jgi:two-component system chemotaxis response regulator CheB